MSTDQANTPEQQQRDAITKRIALSATIDALANEAHRISVSLGWWDERNELSRIAGEAGMGDYARNMIESNLLALTHSELSEGLEGIRKDMDDDHLPQFKMIECELADAMIRILDHAAAYGYRLGDALVAKMEYNKGRGHKHSNDGSKKAF